MKTLMRRRLIKKSHEINMTGGIRMPAGGREEVEAVHCGKFTMRRVINAPQYIMLAGGGATEWSGGWFSFLNRWPNGSAGRLFHHVPCFLLNQPLRAAEKVGAESWCCWDEAAPKKRKRERDSGEKICSAPSSSPQHHGFVSFKTLSLLQGFQRSSSSSSSPSSPQDVGGSKVSLRSSTKGKQIWLKLALGWGDPLPPALPNF